jgi:uncharacterized repeat protein (TIGR01451 family)/gliding motility-associated-like protein
MILYYKRIKQRICSWRIIDSKRELIRASYLPKTNKIQIMKNIKLLILSFVFLPLIAAAQGLDFTTVTEPVFCVNDGSITVTVYNEVGHVQYELVNYSGAKKRSVIGVPQDNPVFLNLAPGTYTVGVYDDNNGTTPITKEVIVPNYGPERTLTISNIYSNQLAYCGTDPNPGSLLIVAPSGGTAPYIITVLDTNDAMVREATSYGSYNFLGMPAGTYKVRVKDNCGTVVNSNSPHVIAPNIVYNFTVSTPTYWYWDNNVKVIHSGTGTICDPVTDAYYDFSYPGGIPVITGNDVYPIYQAPGITKMYAVEYDGVKTPYMTYNELIAYKQPLPTDINTWKPMTLWVSICGMEKSTVYNLTSRRNDFLPKPIANAGVTFYVADDDANTLCAPTGYVTLSRYSLLSGYCDPLTLTVTEKNGVVPPKQYTITGANQNDFEAQLAIGNTYILKLTDANGSELKRFSYVNVTRGQRVNLYSREEIFIDPVNFRPANQDELPIELGSMADFKNFGRSQIGIRDYAMPKPYTAAITGPNGFYMEKVVTTSDSFVGTLLSNNLVLGDYTVRITSAAACYDKTFPITLDRVIDSISVTSTITPDPVACDRYVKTFEYKINNRGILRPYPTNAFEDVFKAPYVGFKVIDGPAGYTQTNAIVNNNTYAWGMAVSPTVTAAFRGDITGLYNINLVDYYTPTNVYGGPWEVDVKSEFPVFDMNGSGGTICTGATTGTLSVVVKNAASPVYYLKKASDANYPTVGQSSSDFPNLTAGDYMVKVETACYPTALETSFKMDYISNIGNIIQGTTDLCDSDTLNLSLKSIGPITNVEWKLPDGTTQTGNFLVLTNPQAGQYSVNVTTRSGCVIPDTIEVKVKTSAVLTDVLATDKTICSGETTLLQATSTTITNPLFTWYSDAGLTNVLSTDADFTTPVLTADTTYYVTVQNADVCENIPTEARAVVVTLNPSGTAADIIADAVNTCSDSTATLNADSTTITNPIFTWYSDANLTDVLGVGASYTTPELITDTIYYVTVKGDNACENLAGTAKEVSVTVHPALVVAPPTPQIAGNQCAFPEINFDSNTAGTLYVWSVDDWSIGLEDNWISSPNMPSFTAINTGTEPVTATVTVYPIGTYCGAGPFTFTITVNPDIILTKPADIKVCTNNTVSEIVFDSNITGTTYSWTNDNPRIGLATVGTGNISAFAATNTGDASEMATITVTPTAAGCAGTPVVFTIEVNPEGTMDKIVDQRICIGETAILTASSSTVINPVFTWYSDAALTNVLAIDATYNANPLVTTTYYVTVKGDNACEGTIGMPVMVAVTEVLPPTGNTRQEFCLAANALVSDLVTNESNVTWYDAATGGNVISAGTILVNGTIYYGSLTAGICESTTRLAVTVIINDAGTPTGNTRQEFCSVSNALVSDLVTNESNVTWYDAANGGNIVSAGTTLVNGTVYYGSLTTGTCESTTRLAVTAIINDAGTPTGNTRQEFCSASNALVSDLVTNESNVTWYDAANGGNIVSAGTTLVNGTIYYGSLTAGTCESTTRLAVTAIINDAQTPTGNTRQEFCLTSNALVSDLVTNESNVTWYDAAIDGNIVSAGTTLVNGTIYYGSLTTGTCESIIRLAVRTIIKTDLPGETIGWKATTCIAEEVTYKTTTAMSDYNWMITGGTIKAGGQLNDDFVTVIWTTAGNGSVEVAFINPSNCNPIVAIYFPVSVSVCSDIAIGKTVNNPTPTIGENVIFTVTTINIGTSDFQHVSIDEMLPSGYSYVISTTTSGNYNSSTGVWNLPVLAAGTTETLTLTAKVKGTGDYLNIASLNASTPTDPNPDNNRAEAAVAPTGVIIYNAVSANGDGINDYFKIEGLEHYPDNTVEIYNRWGVKIYETSRYGANDNVFRGISDGRTTVQKGNIVPAGTYFYILRYQTNAETRIEKSGYLYVN